MLARQFEAAVGGSAPPESKIYTCERPSPVRAIGEFEPMGGVLIAYPGTVAPPAEHKQLAPSGPRAFGIPNELIVRMQQADSADPVQIFVFCDDAAQLPVIQKDLAATAASIDIAFDPNLVHLIPWDTDTYWTRDYGPWWIHNKTTGYYGIAKHVYTTLGGGAVGLVEGAEEVPPREGSGIFRPNDDYGAVRFSDWLNAPIRMWNDASRHDGRSDPIDVNNWYFTGLLDVGGNYMVTGDGVIASSYLVATQNELPVLCEGQATKPDANTVEARLEYILDQLNRFMGIDRYHVLADPTGTYIGHIDCWGKFLSKDKVLIAESQDSETNDALDQIAASFQAEGIEVHRVMCQNTYVPIADTPATTAAYTNSLILNDHVYVPLSGPSYQEFDDEALKVYRQALPEHTIVGIQSKPEFPWLGTDAMHCRTRGVPRGVVNNWLKSLKLK